MLWGQGRYRAVHAMGTGTPVAFHAPEVIQNGIVDVMNGMNDIGTNTIHLP